MQHLQQNLEVFDFRCKRTKRLKFSIVPPNFFQKQLCSPVPQENTPIIEIYIFGMQICMLYAHTVIWEVYMVLLYLLVHVILFSGHDSL